MKKQKWQTVFHEHSKYMISLAKSLVNQYTGVFDSDGINSSSTESFRLLANLLEEDELITIAPEAFRKAYEAWDGEREFKPLFRSVYVNMVKNIARVERRHRLREITLSEVEGKRETRLEARDTHNYMIPCEMVDLVDFLNSFTPTQRVLVDAVLHAKEELDIQADMRPVTIMGALRRYAKQKGLGVREYSRTMVEIGFKLKERSMNGTQDTWRRDPRQGLAY